MTVGTQTFVEDSRQTVFYRSRAGGHFQFLQIKYDSVGTVQFAFLRMLSLEASQNFTYTCINSVAWYDNAARGYDMSLKLLGDNDDEFSAIHNRPNVTEDGCRVIKENWVC